MKYCFKCGDILSEKFQETDGMIPYCTSCEEFRYPIFNAAVSMIIFSKDRSKILLIRQYGMEKNILVAGYINKGEKAEDAVKREIMEEVGLKAVEIEYNRSEYFEKSNTLIFNYACSVEDDDFVIDENEVDSARWFGIEEAKKEIYSYRLIYVFLLRLQDHDSVFWNG